MLGIFEGMDQGEQNFKDGRQMFMNHNIGQSRMVKLVIHVTPMIHNQSASLDE